ncbi:MAG: hypothetical protein F4171_18230 [Gammaproteobacteria bacterium]|nr:hypothetical protein [Gammaproteobacteria bacterium]MYK27284.1 hypothetical protein [Gammaproteobacteria bacterium]
MSEEPLYKLFAWWLADNLAGIALTAVIAALLGALANRWFMVRRIEGLVDKKLAEKTDSANQPITSVRPASAPPTDQERFVDLAPLIRDRLDEVTAHLEAFTDKGREGRGFSHFDCYLSREVYRGLRTRLRSLCEESLFVLGMEKHPQFPGPNYETIKLVEWQDYLDRLYKFSVRNELQKAINWDRAVH